MIPKDKLIKKLPDHAYYRSISDRLMSYLSARLGKLEIFSIDETFAEVTGMANEYGSFAETLKTDIYRDIGIPVSIGISTTRIRAKMLGDLHKPYGTTVEFLREDIESLWKTLPVREIPFIGRGSAERLGASVRTVYDYYSLDPHSISKLLGRNGVVLWLELHGVDSWTPHDTNKKRKSIVVSRSFNDRITNNPDFLWRQALIHFERAYETLLSEKQGASLIGIYLRLRDHSYASKYAHLGEPTIDRSRMISILRTLFDAAHEGGIDYRTVGITFGQLSSFTPRQLSVFDVEGREHETDARLSDALSRLRARYGDSIVHQGYISSGRKKQDIGVLFEVG
jgi:nucleotidyltransferase/DNA polymerase involved in DNA repair